MPTLLSRAAYDRLRAEHDELTTNGRHRIAQLIEDARTAGDIAENPDFHNALDAEAQMEARISYLERTLADVEFTDGTASDVVAVGSVVDIDWGGGDVERYLIGSIEERGGDVDVASPSSPMGEALLGAAVGDTVTFATPGGSASVTVVALG